MQQKRQADNSSTPAKEGMRRGGKYQAITAAAEAEVAQQGAVADGAVAALRHFPLFCHGHSAVRAGDMSSGLVRERTHDVVMTLDQETDHRI